MTPLWYGGAYSGGAASGAIDWDTYENGIWQEVENHPTVSMYNTGGYSTVGALQLKNMTTNQSTWGDYISGWWSYSDRPTAALSSGYVAGDAPPYVAVWDCDLGQWLDVEPFVGIGSNRAIYDDGVGNRMFETYTSSKTNNCVFVALTEDPGDISGWRDYDGPDDWDTWSDGVFKWAYSGLSYFKELKTPDTYNGTTGLVAFTRNGSYHGFRYNANVVADAANTAPYLALWHIESGTWKGYFPRQPIVDWFGTQNGSLYIPINGPVSYGNTYIVVPLHREPTNFANWRDYDGPLFASWDEANRVTLMGGGSTVATTRINIDTYEESPFWTTISTTGTYELVPSSFDRSGTNSFSLTLASSSMDRDALNSNVASASVWFANFIATPYNGWINVPLNGTGNFKTTYSFDVSPHVLNYNNFYTYAPASLIFFGEEVGDTRYWPAYDGPVANWDTYANGVFVINELSTAPPSLIEVPAYPTTTYSPYMADTLSVNTNVGIQTNYNTPEQNADSPPYIAVYIHQYHDDQGGYAHNAKGWYVFERPAIPTGNSSMVYTPYAWPGDVSTGDTVNLNNDEGYLGSGGNDNFGYVVVFLDEYNDPVGSGGTDHWTKPPMVHIGQVSSVNTASNEAVVDWGTYLAAGSGSFDGVYNGFDLGAWPYNTIRGTAYAATTGKTRVIAWTDIGEVSFELYTNGTLTHTGTLSTTGVTGYSTKDIALTEEVYADFDAYINAVTVGDDIVFVIYYND